MNPKRIGLVLTFVSGIAIGCLTSQLINAHPSLAQQSTLLTTDLDSIPGKEAKIWIREIAPGEHTAKHYHPGEVISYVLEGTVSHSVEGKTAITYSAGQAFHESAKEIHIGSNASTTERVKILAVQISDKGEPATIIAK